MVKQSNDGETKTFFSSGSCLWETGRQKNWTRCPGVCHSDYHAVNSTATVGTHTKGVGLVSALVGTLVCSEIIFLYVGNCFRFYRAVLGLHHLYWTSEQWNHMWCIHLGIPIYSTFLQSTLTSFKTCFHCRMVGNVRLAGLHQLTNNDLLDSYLLSGWWKNFWYLSSFGLHFPIYKAQKGKKYQCWDQMKY